MNSEYVPNLTEEPGLSYEQNGRTSYTTLIAGSYPKDIQACVAKMRANNVAATVVTRLLDTQIREMDLDGNLDPEN